MVKGLGFWGLLGLGVYGFRGLGFRVLTQEKRIRARAITAEEKEATIGAAER